MCEWYDLCSALQRSFSCSISELQLGEVQPSVAEQPLHRAWSSPAGGSVDCQACCESLRRKIKSSMPEFGVIIVLLVVVQLKDSKYIPHSLVQVQHPYYC